MDLILFLQQFDFPVVIYVFKGITLVGDPEFYFIALAVIHFFWRKEETLPLSILLLVSFIINIGLKEFYSISRPPEELFLITATGHGFPSGHAQVSIVLWNYIAWRLQNFFWPTLLVLLIGMSRVYLGVHYFDQVLFGWSVGFATVVLGIITIDYIQGKLVLNSHES